MLVLTVIFLSIYVALFDESFRLRRAITRITEKQKRVCAGRPRMFNGTPCMMPSQHVDCDYVSAYAMVFSLMGRWTSSSRMRLFGRSLEWRLS